MDYGFLNRKGTVFGVLYWLDASDGSVKSQGVEPVEYYSEPYVEGYPNYKYATRKMMDSIREAKKDLIAQGVDEDLINWDWSSVDFFLDDE